MTRMQIKRLKFISKCFKQEQEVVIGSEIVTDKARLIEILSKSFSEKEIHKYIK